MESGALPKEMQDALAKFSATADEILKSFLMTIEARPTPEIIYHYTNDIGLRGILETGQIWLSDIFCLNDPSELRHGVSLAVDVLSSKADRGPPESKIFARHFSEFYERGMQGTAHYFVCSFSLDGNDLGQWRAYADNGRGYAIGFDGNALEEIFTKAHGVAIENNCTFHVTYDDEALVSIYRQVIDSMFDLISLPRGMSLDSAMLNAYMKELSIALSLPVLRAALFFKHNAYSPESEFRFLQMFRGDIPAPDVKCRHRPYEMVKYREFAWSGVRPEMLKRIVVGPAADHLKAGRFARDSLDAFNAGDVEITNSDIPYRAIPA